MAFFAGLEINPGADIVAPVVDWINAAGPGYGADPSGVADATAAVQSALDAAATAGGGVVYLPAGSYKVSNITIDSKVTLMGDGAATVLTAKAGASGYMIALKHPASSYRVTIRDLALSPATGTLGGIQIDNTGFTSGGGETDPLHIIDGVYVQSAGGDSFHFDNNARSMRVTRCMAYSSGAAGFYVGTGCTDTTFVSCTSGSSVGHGWDVRGVDNYFASCKGFFAGWNGSVFDTSHNAWDIQGSWNSFVACMAQNGALHGFNLYNAGQHNTLAACVADANNSGGTTGVGINTSGITNCVIAGCSGDNHGGAGQLYGLQVAGTQTGTILIGNTVTGSTGHFNYVSGGGYFLLDASAADFSGLTSTQFANVDVKVAGSGLQVAEGSNCKQGTAVLVAGSKVVSNTSVTASSRILLTSNADGGTPGFLRVSARTAGASFTITSSSGTDTSTVAYEIFEPG